MNTKSIIYLGLGLISVVVALIIFFRGLDIKALLFLILGVAAVLLFRQGLSEMKNKKEKNGTDYFEQFPKKRVIN